MSADPKDAKKGKKITHNLEGVNIAIGLKEPPAEKGEVKGHMSPYPGAWYLCVCNGHGPWWVPGGWFYFICPACGCTTAV